MFSQPDIKLTTETPRFKSYPSKVLQDSKSVQFEYKAKLTDNNVLQITDLKNRSIYLILEYESSFDAFKHYLTNAVKLFSDYFASKISSAITNKFIVKDIYTSDKTTERDVKLVRSLLSKDINVSNECGTIKISSICRDLDRFFINNSVKKSVEEYEESCISLNKNKQAQDNKSKTPITIDFFNLPQEYKSFENLQKDQKTLFSSGVKSTESTVHSRKSSLSI